MKVLLVGEFSGLYKNLKEGLLELGQEVILAADGDGWKKIGGADLTINSHSRNYINTIKELRMLKEFDIVQVVTPNLYRREFNHIAFRMLKKQNKNLVLSGAGDSYITYKAFKEGKYRYCSNDGNHEFQNYYEQRILGKIRKNSDLKIISMSDAIIPISYEYAEAFRSFVQVEKTIPIPLNYKKITYSQNKIRNGKICFFHGINRVIPKGSNYIVNAMEKLKEKYPHDVEIIIREHMPLKEYLEIMSYTNVVLDQCKSYSLGLNALYAMAEGKIVLGGNEPEGRKELGITYCPALNILPDERQIIKTMERILEQKKQVEEKGWQSRQYIERYHSHIKVAKRYIDVWNKINSHIL